MPRKSGQGFTIRKAKEEWEWGEGKAEYVW